MGDVEKVVARFNNGQILKVHFRDFEVGTETAMLEDPGCRGDFNSGCNDHEGMIPPGSFSRQLPVFLLI